MGPLMKLATNEGMWLNAMNVPSFWSGATMTVYSYKRGDHIASPRDNSATNMMPPAKELLNTIAKGLNAEISAPQLSHARAALHADDY